MTDADFDCNSIPAVPSGADIERFFTQVPTMVKGKGTHYKDSVTQSLMTGAFAVLHQYFQFQYPAFRLSSTEKLRIRSLFGQLRKNGDVTLHRKFDVHWLGICVVRQMIRGLLTDALDNGTLNWDVTLFTAFSIIFISATGARAGDVALSIGYDVQYLRWHHVKVSIFDADDGEETIGIHVELAYNKGHK